MGPETALPVTGERTVPGVWHENYWYRRHEAVYREVARHVRGRVLEAGCGEGYGASMLHATGADVTALDYDRWSTTHVRTARPGIRVVQGNLVMLPFASGSFDHVVSLQTVEHLWEQERFVAECVRVLAPGGRLWLSTPDATTFPPGNVFHHRELDAGELVALVEPHARVERLAGLHHGPRLAAWERANGDLAGAQLAGPPEVWPPALAELVRTTSAADFELRDGAATGCLDLVLVASAPPGPRPSRPGDAPRGPGRRR